MMLSRDEKIRESMRWFAENERQHRCIGEDMEADFLNWKDEIGEKGTASLTVRTRRTCKQLKIGLKVNEDELIVKTEESEFKTRTAVGVGRFLTQKVIRPAKFKKLVEHEVHGASYVTLKGNETSNSILTNIYTRKSDAFFRFVVVGRADCLPTPVNLRRWFGDDREERCTRCGNERQQTLAHILNECTRNYPLMTKRHNRLANVVRRGIERFLIDELRSQIQENTEIGIEELPEHLRRQRPDMVFERRRVRNRAAGEVRFYRNEGEQFQEERILEIIEFSCPYGYKSRGKDTLEKVYEEKKRKYMELARNLKRLTEKEVRITAVIVSSMGAVYDKSLRDLKTVLNCTDKELKKLGKRMSEAVLTGSLEIWRRSAQEFRYGSDAVANHLIAEEVESLEQEETGNENGSRNDTDIIVDLEREETGDQLQEESEDEFEPVGGREEAEYTGMGLVQDFNTDEAVDTEIMTAVEERERGSELGAERREVIENLEGGRRTSETGETMQIQARFEHRNPEDIGLVENPGDNEDMINVSDDDF
jgi:hypothetical protein